MLDLSLANLGKRLALADGNLILERDARPPPSPQPLLLGGREDSRAIRRCTSCMRQRNSAGSWTRRWITDRKCSSPCSAGRERRRPKPASISHYLSAPAVPSQRCCRVKRPAWYLRRTYLDWITAAMTINTPANTAGSETTASIPSVIRPNTPRSSRSRPACWQTLPCRGRRARVAAAKIQTVKTAVATRRAWRPNRCALIPAICPQRLCIGRLRVGPLLQPPNAGIPPSDTTPQGIRANILCPSSRPVTKDAANKTAARFPGRLSPSLHPGL